MTQSRTRPGPLAHAGQATTRLQSKPEELLAFAREFRWQPESVQCAVRRAYELCNGEVARESLRYEIVWSIAYRYSNYIESELFGDDLLAVDEGDDDYDDDYDDDGSVDEAPAWAGAQESDLVPVLPGILDAGVKARLREFVRQSLKSGVFDWMYYLVVHSGGREFTRTRIAYARNLLRWLGYPDVQGLDVEAEAERLVLDEPRADQLERFFGAICQANRARLAALDHFDLDVACTGQAPRSALAIIREILAAQRTRCIIVVGPPCSGRTPLARHIVSELNDSFVVLPVLDIGRGWDASLPWIEPLSRFIDGHLGAEDDVCRRLVPSIFYHASKPVVVVFDGFDEYYAGRDCVDLARLMRSFYHLCDAGAHIVITAQEDMFYEDRRVRAYLGRLDEEAALYNRASGRQTVGHDVLRIVPLTEAAQREHARRALRSAGRGEDDLDVFMQWLEDLHIADSRMYPSVLRAAGQAFLRRSSSPPSKRCAPSVSIIDLIARSGLDDEGYDVVANHLEKASLAPLSDGLVLQRDGPECALLRYLSIVKSESTDNPREVRVTFVHEIYRTHFFARKALREIRDGEFDDGDALRRIATSAPMRTLSLCMRYFADPDIIRRIEAYLCADRLDRLDRLEVILWHVLLTTRIQSSDGRVALGDAACEPIVRVARDRFFACCTRIRSQPLLGPFGLTAGAPPMPTSPGYGEFYAAVLAGRELAILLGALGAEPIHAPSFQYLATLNPAATRVLVNAIVAYDGVPERTIGRIVEHYADCRKHAALLEIDTFILEQLLCGPGWARPGLLRQIKDEGHLARMQAVVSQPRRAERWLERLERLIRHVTDEIREQVVAPVPTVAPEDGRTDGVVRRLRT